MKTFCTFLLIVSSLSVLIGCIKVNSPDNIVPSSVQTTIQTTNQQSPAQTTRQTSQVTVTTTQTIVQTKTTVASQITTTPLNPPTMVVTTPSQATMQNPSFAVTINRVGVIHDHDPIIKGAGDIYLYVGVSDGKGEPQVTRIPSTGTLSLKDNESKDVSTRVFFTSSPGNQIRLVTLAFESDSAIAAAAGKIAVEGLGMYLTYKYGGYGFLVGELIKSQVTQSEDGAPMELAESPSDDYVGAIEKNFSSSSNWGIGSYTDVTGGDLKLSFTISQVN